MKLKIALTALILIVMASVTYFEVNHSYGQDTVTETPKESKPVNPPNLDEPVLDQGIEMDVVTKSLKHLVSEKKSVLSVSIAVLMLLLQLIKSKLVKGWFGSRSRLVRRSSVIVLGQVLAIFSMVSMGQSWLTSIIAGLITSGGAVAIYELAIKPWMKKN